MWTWPSLLGKEIELVVFNSASLDYKYYDWPAKCEQNFIWWEYMQKKAFLSMCLAGAWGNLYFMIIIQYIFVVTYLGAKTIQLHLKIWLLKNYTFIHR